MGERLVRVARRMLEVVRRDGQMVDRAECGRPLVFVGEQRVKTTLAVGAVIVRGAALVTVSGQTPVRPSSVVVLPPRTKYRPRTWRSTAAPSSCSGRG